MHQQNREPAGRLIWLVVAALAAWGLYHAFGAIRFNHDVRRGMMVFACMAAFLGIWLMLLKHKKNRQHRRIESWPHSQPPSRTDID
jgi:hypothetical protein